MPPGSSSTESSRCGSISPVDSLAHCGGGYLRRGHSLAGERPSLLRSYGRRVCLGWVRETCSSSCSFLSRCWRNARSTATHMVFENGYPSIGTTTISGIRIASSGTTGTFGTVSASATATTTMNTAPASAMMIATAPAAAANGDHVGAELRPDGAQIVGIGCERLGIVEHLRGEVLERNPNAEAEPFGERREHPRLQTRLRVVGDAVRPHAARLVITR